MNEIKCEIKEYNFGIDVIKNYYVNGKYVGSHRDRTFFYHSGVGKEKVKADAQKWCRLCDGETFKIGADSSLLDDECGLILCCPIKNGVDGFECTGVCAKYNCGAVLVMCSECKTHHYDSSGSCQFGHNEPTTCECK